jgi:long-chain acyl-CoA synthetase
MQVQKAVLDAQKRVGLATEQPAYGKSLLAVWQQAVADSSSRPAFTCLGHTLSYGEVDQLARRVASYFQRQLKLVPGDRIAVQLPNLVQYPVVVIAAWKLGLVIVNVNPMYTPRELEHQLNDAGVKAVVVLDQFYETLLEVLPSTSIEHVIVTRPIDLLPDPKGGISAF